MFDRIVPRYDLMNRLMTGGRDVTWRRLAVREALRGRNLAEVRILDVATGTGDLALALRSAGAAVVVGLDFSAPMLVEATRKEAAAVGDRRVSWVEGDAMSLQFADESFDAVTVAFGLRNMPSYPAALGEMLRVLRPAGTLVCLETTTVQAPVLRAVFDWYFARVVPIIGGVLSGDADAYRYLPASAAAFPDAEALGHMMLEVGFSKVRYLRRGLGTVALHVATKAGTKWRDERTKNAGSRL
jgi:demethylmenaquinone methyltransferase/2-methoxy-6-polyprenyl-1,4-benzoquinol methylase